ncbi:MAG: aspartyl protease family protein [Bdellovibrionaceae bacterium]|nr:aspartyl protease family protein [Pseudobdellovibrionaceae bacterium]
MSKIELEIKFDDDFQDTAEVWIRGFIEGIEQRFILDTGCSRTSLCFNDFSAKFNSLGEREYSSAFGKALSDFIEVKNISAGPIDLKNVLISRTRKDGNDKNLFGMDLLKDSILHFLPGDKALEIIPAFPQDLVSEALYLDSGSIPFIELNFPDAKAIAVWDTGAGITIVDKHFFDSHLEFFDSYGMTTGTDSAGHTFETEIYRMKPINIYGLSFPAHRVVPLSLGHIADKTGRGMDFILGYSTLRHANWLMDFAGGRWAITKTLF